jgi:4-hydroxy-3-methylbut-2-en-1-yl diphosphate reductase
MLETLRDTQAPSEILKPQRELLIAGDRGPCGGVNMAIDTTFQVLDLVAGRENVYANNPPVHNKPIMEEFAQRGLIIEPDVNQLPQGSIYLLSAHGTPPSLTETASSLGLIVVNVECQYVSTVRRREESAIAKGQHVAYFGAKDHPEPQAVLKDLPPEGITFIDIHSDEFTPIPHHRPVIVLNQTTLSTKDIQSRKRELEEELQRELPDPKGICYATDNRQNAVRFGLFGDLDKKADTLVVVGSSTSHNSQELKNIGVLELGEENSYLIDSPDELNEDWFRDSRIVGLTSGASVIDRYSEPVIEWFRERGFKLTLAPGKEKDLIFKGPSLEALRLHLSKKYSS